METRQWRPIGTILIEQGAIMQEDLDAALADQRVSGRRLGEILIDSGRLSWLALANAIAEQAKDLDAPSAPPARAAAAVIRDIEGEDEHENVVDFQAAPAPTGAGSGGFTAPPLERDAASRLQTVEAMLKERQRAFLELVSTTETLRKTVSKLQEQLAARDEEIARLRAEARATAAG